MCNQRIEPAAVLATLALGGSATVWLACGRKTGGRSCLECLAEALHDAADLVEGAAERMAAGRITPPPDA